MTRALSGRSATRWTVSGGEQGLSSHERLLADVRAGLWEHPPTLPARWFYDEKGSLLFDDITRLEEYYPTRRETEILTTHAADIVELTGADTLVELGSGTSTKTRILLDAFTVDDRALLFVPLDVSVEVLVAAALQIADTYPTVTVDGIVADFADDWPLLPGTPGRRLVAFLGGTIGNLTYGERTLFFRRLHDALAPGDHLLLGADLVKDAARLVAAYDDASGVTAAFNRNLIDVLARELDAVGLESDAFDHVAHWNATEHRIEMWLQANRPIRAYFGALERTFALEPGDQVRTEISVKFELPALREELSAAGLRPVETWTDAAGDFSLTLARAE